jgi:hypothetical protein
VGSNPTFCTFYFFIIKEKKKSNYIQIIFESIFS